MLHRHVQLPAAVFIYSWLHSTMSVSVGKLSPSCAYLQLDRYQFVGKLSDLGQPTKPTQPFILVGSINEQ